MTKTLFEVEREAILAALEASGDCVVEAAKALGVGKSTLFRKLKQYGCQRRPYCRHDLKPVQLKPSFQSKEFLKLPRNDQEFGEANLVCPVCHSRLMLPSEK
jgi:transposase